MESTFSPDTFGVLLKEVGVAGNMSVTGAASAAEGAPPEDQLAAVLQLVLAPAPDQVCVPAFAKPQKTSKPSAARSNHLTAGQLVWHFLDERWSKRWMTTFG